MMKRYSGPDLSLARFLDQERPLPGARRIVELLYAHAAAADPEEVGIRGTGSEAAAASEDFGYNNFQLVEGYDELAARRSASFRDRVRLNTRVTGIRYDGGGVRIDASSDEGVLEVRARCAVITLPLGVLKAEDVVFDPPLPEGKRDAIRSTGFGDATVILIRLRRGNLFERLGDFGILWGGGATTFHRPYVGVKGIPPVLSAFVVGREARQRAALSDADAAEATRAELEGVLPSNMHTGEVEAFAVGRWTSNPFVRGGYSFLPVGADLRQRRALAAPVAGVLFFAGEATHTGGESATVHGAIATGYRAADEALQLLRRPGNAG
jgi:monoamine oxidase